MEATVKMLEKKLVRGEPVAGRDATVEAAVVMGAGGAERGGVPYVDIELLGVITLNRFFWPKRTTHQLIFPMTKQFHCLLLMIIIACR